MKERFAVLFFPKKTKINSAGMVPIYLRITIDGIRGEFSLKLKIPIDKWDDVKECAKGSSGDAVRLNSEIERIKSRLYAIKSTAENAEAPLTTQMALNALNNINAHANKTIIDAIETQYERVYNQVGTGFSQATAKRYNTIKLHMKVWIASQPI